MIFITFDESGNDANAGACCGEKDSLGFSDPSHPNTNEPGLYGPGGGRVGAVVLSPFIKPGTVSLTDYNHYSLLKTVERIFGLDLLGDARQPQVNRLRIGHLQPQLTPEWRQRPTFHGFPALRAPVLSRVCGRGNHETCGQLRRRRDLSG